MKNKINLILIILFFISTYLFVPKKELDNKMVNLTGKTKEQIIEYANNNDLNLEIIEEYSDKEKNYVIDQNIEENEIIKEKDKLIITISKGLDYQTLKVDELGNIPIMMYHGIQDVENKYVGGNIDKDGYQRTAKAFREDLEFYYQNNYRMIRLNDYVNGKINVEAGKSPIIITFDDGLANNIKVTGLDENGNIIIDPNSAVGILEEFKNKYPDFNITATFFVNGGLFNQSEYNEKILKWLVDNNYDIGNHSYSHSDFTSISKEKSVQEIGNVYNLLDKYISGKYVNIVALPYGSPYNKNHQNFNSILNGEYNNKIYETISTLRVGWESEVSPFSINFDKTFLKRIRAYDNNGLEFDIEMNFKLLESTRYISDGDENTISIPKYKETSLNNVYNLNVITYWHFIYMC